MHNYKEVLAIIDDLIEFTKKDSLAEFHEDFLNMRKLFIEAYLC